MGWILAGADAGRIPKPTFTARRLATVGLQLALERKGTPMGPLECMPLGAPIKRQLLNHDSFGFAHGAIDIVLVHNGVASEPVRYRTDTPSRLEARAGPLDLQISPGPGGPVLCRAA
jgi:hypothetical protein